MIQDTDKLNDINVIDWNRINITQWNSTDLNKLFYKAIDAESPQLITQLLDVGVIMNQVNKHKLLGMVTYAMLQPTTPNNRMYTVSKYFPLNICIRHNKKI